MRVFIIGITGAVGGMLARRLATRGDDVGGLVRQPDQQAKLAEWGIAASVGNLAEMSAGELADVIGKADTVVFAAGSNGGARDVTLAIDGDGVHKGIDAARLAGGARFVLLSVLPESWRERDLSDDEEYYFAVKKAADVAVSRSGLDWVILRPSLLTDDPPTGAVSLGPAELHGEISRGDVAVTLAELVHELRISRQILELNTGPTPIPEAVKGNIRAN